MKMRKLALVLVAALMLTLLGGCCLSHEWMAATCENPKTCVKCEKTEGEALGHTWADADCVTAKTCTVCGKTEGEALGHTWADADCVTAKTCTVCSETEGEALGHQVNWVPHAEDFEKMSGTCTVCGEAQEEAVDWEKVSPSFVVGTWKGTKVSADGMKFVDLVDDSSFEIREDGTATLNFLEEVYEFTWAFNKYGIPYENMKVAACLYDFIHADGGVSTVGITYFFGRENDSLYLYVGDTITIFTK